jgi:hypothetical protein
MPFTFISVEITSLFPFVLKTGVFEHYFLQHSSMELIGTYIHKSQRYESPALKSTLHTNVVWFSFYNGILE